jgi:predicted PurR-regulated permease PerM
VLALVLAPIVRLFSRTGLPRALTSAAVVIAAMALVGAILARLSTPGAEWFSRVPEAVYRLRYAFREVVGTLQNVKEITEDMAKLSPGQEDEQVVMQGLDLTQVFLTNTGQLITMVVITAVLLYFLLANGYLFLQKTVHILPTFSEKKRAVEIGRDLQVVVSRYLLTITAINLALGCATAAVMAAFGLPDPLLWGVLATTLNFMPYAGAILTSVAILLASVIAFPADPLYAIYPPLAFVVLTALEGNVITPMLVGRRLTLNPVIIFFSGASRASGTNGRRIRPVSVGSNSPSRTRESGWTRRRSAVSSERSCMAIRQRRADSVGRGWVSPSAVTSSVGSVAAST